MSTFATAPTRAEEHLSSVAFVTYQREGGKKVKSDVAVKDDNGKDNDDDDDDDVIPGGTAGWRAGATPSNVAARGREAASRRHFWGRSSNSLGGAGSGGDGGAEKKAKAEAVAGGKSFYVGSGGGQGQRGRTPRPLARSAALTARTEMGETLPSIPPMASWTTEQGSFPPPTRQPQTQTQTQTQTQGLSSPRGSAPLSSSAAAGIGTHANEAPLRSRTHSHGTARPPAMTAAARARTRSGGDPRSFASSLSSSASASASAAAAAAAAATTAASSLSYRYISPVASSSSSGGGAATTASRSPRTMGMHHGSKPRPVRRNRSGAGGGRHRRSGNDVGRGGGGNSSSSEESVGHYLDEPRARVGGVVDGSYDDDDDYDYDYGVGVGVMAAGGGMAGSFGTGDDAAMRLRRSHVPMQPSFPVHTPAFIPTPAQMQWQAQQPQQQQQQQQLSHEQLPIFPPHPHTHLRSPGGVPYGISRNVTTGTAVSAAATTVAAGNGMMGGTRTSPTTGFEANAIPFYVGGGGEGGGQVVAGDGDGGKGKEKEKEKEKRHRGDKSGGKKFAAGVAKYYNGKKQKKDKKTAATATPTNNGHDRGNTSSTKPSLALRARTAANSAAPDTLSSSPFSTYGANAPLGNNDGSVGVAALPTIATTNVTATAANNGATFDARFQHAPWDITDRSGAPYRDTLSPVNSSELDSYYHRAGASGPGGLVMPGNGGGAAAAAAAEADAAAAAAAAAAAGATTPAMGHGGICAAMTMGGLAIGTGTNAAVEGFAHGLSTPRPPHPYEDDGTPSESVSDDAIRVLRLIRDERHLVAYELLRDARGRIESWEGKHPDWAGVIFRPIVDDGHGRGGNNNNDRNGGDYDNDNDRNGGDYDNDEGEGEDGNWDECDEGGDDDGRMEEEYNHGKFLGGAGAGVALSRGLPPPVSTLVDARGGSTRSIRTSPSLYSASSALAAPFKSLARGLLSTPFKPAKRRGGDGGGGGGGGGTDGGGVADHSYSFDGEEEAAAEDGYDDRSPDAVITVTIGAGPGPTLTTTMTRAQREEMEDCVMGRRILMANEDELDRLEKRALLFHRAKQNLTIDDDWIKAQTLFGVTTYYRREADHSLSIKLEGELIGVPLFEQLAVLRETDLYHTWAPFCTASRKLAQLGRIDVVSWFVTGIPGFGLSRDACFRAVGCDCMREDGSILLVGEGLGDKPEDGVRSSADLNDGAPMSPPGGRRARRRSMDGSDESRSASDHPPSSAAAAAADTTSRRMAYAEAQSVSGIGDSYNDLSFDQTTSRFFWDDEAQVSGSYLSRDKILDTIEIPPVPTKFGCGRMTIRSFQGVIDVLSPSSARTRIVSNIDPNLRFLPQSLVDFCMKKMCGVMLSRLQGTARKVIKDPVRSHHARRMREDARFYRRWLLPKFRAYCEDLGWEMPPVAAFNVPKEDLDVEEWLLYSRTGDGGAVRQSMYTGEMQAVPPAGAVGNGRGGKGGGVATAPTAPTTPALTSVTSRSVGSAPVAATHSGGEAGGGVCVSVSSAPNMPTGGGGGNAARPPLSAERFHFFPSRSMSDVMGLAHGPNLLEQLSNPQNLLSAPQLVVQHIQMKRDRKKALDVASARRKAALQIRPKPLSKDRQRRVRQLKAAKRRYEEKASRISADSGGRSGGEVARGMGGFEEGGTITPHGKAVRMMSGCDPRAPGTKTLPALIAALFAFFQLNMERHLSSPFASDSDAFMGWVGIVLGLIAREVFFVGFLCLSAAIFWSVLTTALIVAFDSIQLPGGLDYSKLQSGKRIYVKSIRLYVAYMTAAIVALSTVKAMVLGLWNSIVLHPVKLIVRSSLMRSCEVLSAYWSRLEQLLSECPVDLKPQIALPDAVADARGRISSVLVAAPSALWSYFGPAVLAVADTLNDYIWECRMTSLAADKMLWIWRGIPRAASALSRLIAYLVAESHSKAWRLDAVDTTKSTMSYVAVFVVSVLLVAGVAMPKAKSTTARRVAVVSRQGSASVSEGGSGGGGGESDAAAASSSSSRQSSVSSFSLASSRELPIPSDSSLEGGGGGGGSSVQSAASALSARSRSTSAGAGGGRSVGIKDSDDDGNAVGRGLMRGIASREETIYEAHNEDDEEDETGNVNDEVDDDILGTRDQQQRDNDDDNVAQAEPVANAGDGRSRAKNGKSKVKKNLKKMRWNLGKLTSRAMGERGIGLKRRDGQEDREFDFDASVFDSLPSTAIPPALQRNTSSE